MSKRRRIILSALFLLVLISIVNLNAISFYLPQSDRTVLPKVKNRTVSSPTGIKTVARPDIPVNLYEAEYIQRTAECLQALADSGASDEAITKTHLLMSELFENPGTTSEALFQVLTDTVSFFDSRNEDIDDLISRIPELKDAKTSWDIVYRAMAACYERSKMRPDRIILTFAGDCTFGAINGEDRERGFPRIFQKAGNLSYPFDKMKPWFLNDDLTVVNCEGTLTTETRTADKQWKFRGLPEYAAIFSATSVEVAGLSNNHSFDYLEEGFDQTKANLQGQGVGLFYRKNPYITQVKGVEVVIIGDCTVVGENTTVNEGVTERVVQQIAEYKKPDNIVAVVMHWGSELSVTPFKWQQDAARQFIDAGADIVVGHHPHVVQGIELYNGKYIVYSLGNFAFGGNPLTKYPSTFVFRIEFAIDNSRIMISGATIVPCYTSTSTRRLGGILQNNFQPKPLFGKEAEQVVKLILERSRPLANGINEIDYFRIEN